MPALASHPTHFHGQNTQTNPYPSKASVSQRYFLTSMKNRCGFKTTNPDPDPEAQLPNQTPIQGIPEPKTAPITTSTASQQQNRPAGRLVGERYLWDRHRTVNPNVMQKTHTTPPNHHTLSQFPKVLAGYGGNPDQKKMSGPPNQPPNEPRRHRGPRLQAAM